MIRQSDRGWISAGGYAKVEFEPPIATIKRQVDAGIELLIAHLCKVRHAGAPLALIAADQIVALARQFANARDPRLGSGADEFDHFSFTWQAADAFVRDQILLVEAR